MLLVLFGCVSLGIVVAWLVRYFLEHLRTMTPKVLTSVVLIVTGSSSTALLKPFTQFYLSSVAYFIGLLIGIVIYPALRRLDKIISGEN
jgi:cytosine/uracil/thiamine/allantoin permease